MRKYSQLAPQRKDISHLLAELATIDLQSTELRVAQLMQKQRSNYRQVRGIDTSRLLQPTQKRIKFSIETKTEKENHIHAATQLSKVIVSSSGQVANHRSRTTISNTPYRLNPSTQRYFGSQLQERKKKEKLPALLGKQRKGSTLLCEQKDRVLETKQEESFCGDLPVIREDALQGLRDTFVVTKLRKQRSWAPSNTQSRQSYNDL